RARAGPGFRPWRLAGRSLCGRVRDRGGQGFSHCDAGRHGYPLDVGSVGPHRGHTTGVHSLCRQGAGEAPERGMSMNLGRRIVVTVGWNLAFALVPWAMFHISRAVMLWGAFRGYWDMPYW